MKAKQVRENKVEAYSVALYYLDFVGNGGYHPFPAGTFNDHFLSIPHLIMLFVC